MSRSSSNLLTDFEVRCRDSIIVRSEVTVPQQMEEGIHQLADALVFTLESGVQHRIPLTVAGQNAFFMRGRVLHTDTVFTSLRPIVVYDSLVVAAGVSLTMQPGTQLLFHDGAGMVVHGRLQVNGTVDEPVVWRGDRTDHMFDYLPYDRLPSRWEGVRLTAESTGNVLSYVDLHGGKYGIACDSADVDVDADIRRLTMNGSRLHCLGGDGLHLHASTALIENCEVSNTLGDCVAVCGGDVRLIHCTLAQFYPFDAARGVALSLANHLNNVPCPLYRAEVVNSIITGYAADELMGYWHEDESVLSNYMFRNCLIATDSVTDARLAERFVGVVYEAAEGDYVHSKAFSLMDTHAFLYDFTPVAESAARNIADPSWSTALPTDRMGRDRLSDGAPDAGCYEFVATEK